MKADAHCFKNCDLQVVSSTGRASDAEARLQDLMSDLQQHTSTAHHQVRGQNSAPAKSGAHP